MGAGSSWFRDSDTSRNRPIGVSESALLLQDVDFDHDGCIADFFAIAESDRDFHRKKARFDANTKQLDSWTRRVEKLQQDLSDDAEALQNQYLDDLHDIEYGCPHVHVQSPYIGLHRRVKSEMLGAVYESS